MAEDEIQEELNILGNQAAPPEPENIQMGFVRTFFNNADPVMHLRKEMVAGSIEVPTGVWTNYFTPKPRTIPQFHVPLEWANFFATLLSPSHFERAKELLKSSALMAAIGGPNSIGLNIPSSCPVKAPSACTIIEEEQNTADTEKPEKEGEKMVTIPILGPEKESLTSIADTIVVAPGPVQGPNIASENEGITSNSDHGPEKEDLIPTAACKSGPRKKRTPVLVDSQVRRSPRIKKLQQRLQDFSVQ